MLRPPEPSSPLPPLAVTVPPEEMVTPRLLVMPSPPSLLFVPSPPAALTVPPEMVRLPRLVMPLPPEPFLPSPPLALTVPPEMVRSLLKMPRPPEPSVPLPPWAVRLSVSPPEMVRLPLLEMPLRP